MLGTLNTRLEQSEAVAELLKDPDIAEVIRRKQAGEDIKLAEQQVDDPFEGLEQGDDNLEVNLMSNADLLSSVKKELTQALPKLIQEAVKVQMEPLESAVVSERATRMKKDIEDKISAAKAKYKDFDKYGEQMLGIHREYGNLQPDDLYRLAKKRYEEENPSATELASEVPTGLVGLRQTTPPETIRHGTKGFEAIMEESLARRYR